MRRPTLARQWRVRLLEGVAVGVIGYVAAALLDFDPQPAAYGVMVVIVLSAVWLVLDTIDAPAARWLPGLPTTTDRVDEATSDLRLLSSHAQASTPSPAVRDRLASLARTRDPVLADALLHELDALRRLSPAEIDRILTRIEEARDRS